MTSKLGYLSAQDIFRDLGPDEVEQIGRLTTMTTCAPRKVFYEPEDKSEVLFLLKKGRVQLYRLSPGGKKMVTGIIEAGAFFGEMALIGQGMHRAFAEAIEDCVLCVMSRADVERYLLGHPKIAMRLTEALGNRLVEAEARLEEMAFKGVPARLASLLLRLAPGNRVEGYTHQDFAEAVGSYRETVTQTLNEFKAQGLVEIERKAVRLLDRERLHAIASSQENNQK
jgi:CRP-like cAMP-binding protein